MIAFLTAVPAWFVFAVFFFLCIGVLPIGRKKFEGFPYNISMASAYGDVALIVIVLIAQEILKREGVPQWMSPKYQVITAIACIAVGVIDHGVAVVTSGSWGEVVDAYHNLFIVPLIVYSVLVIAFPVILSRGSFLESLVAVLPGLIWAKTFIFDWKEGRLQQRKYLKSHQVTQV